MMHETVIKMIITKLKAPTYSVCE